MKNSYGAPSFNEYAAGAKIYGGGRYNPTMGPVDKTGYADRDRKRAVRRNALQARLKATGKKAYGSSDAGRYM
jgi:hypothetical protein